MVITWLSPLFGQLSAPGRPAGAEHFYISEHPKTALPCLIPKEWLCDTNRDGTPMESLFGLSV
jgi:hypothetical protein